MFILRFIFKSALAWLATKVLGRIFPWLGRILRVFLR